MKFCNKCKQNLPISEFYKSPKCKCGIRSHCKKCEAIYRKNHRNIYNKANQKYKIANQDKIKNYYIANSDYIKAKSKNRYKENKLYCLNQQKEYYYKNQKERLLYAKKRRTKERSRVNRLKRNARKRNIKKYAPRELQATHIRRSKCKKTNISIKWLKGLKDKAIFCPICDAVLNEKSFDPACKHLDHIIPLNANGLHVKSNVRILCQTCNLERPKDGSDVSQGIHLQEA